MPTTTPPVITRRKTGASLAIAYGKAGSDEIAFSGADAKWVKNAYSVTRSMSNDEIDVTAFGDHPFKVTEPGFIEFSIDVGMRHAVVVGGDTAGALAEDCEFFEEHALSRTPFRIAIIDDRNSPTPNGFLLTVVATQADGGGEYSGAQDNKYTLKLASGGLPPKRIKRGVATEITFAS